jgi:hypothetical protein
MVRWIAGIVRSPNGIVRSRAGIVRSRAGRVLWANVVVNAAAGIV